MRGIIIGIGTNMNGSFNVVFNKSFLLVFHIHVNQHLRSKIWTCWKQIEGVFFFYIIRLKADGSPREACWSHITIKHISESIQYPNTVNNCLNHILHHLISRNCCLNALSWTSRSLNKLWLDCMQLSAEAACCVLTNRITGFQKGVSLEDTVQGCYCIRDFS